MFLPISPNTNDLITSHKRAVFCYQLQFLKRKNYCTSKMVLNLKLAAKAVLLMSLTTTSVHSQSTCSKELKELGELGGIPGKQTIRSIDYGKNEILFERKGGKNCGCSSVSRKLIYQINLSCSCYSNHMFSLTCFRFLSRLKYHAK